MARLVTSGFELGSLAVEGLVLAQGTNSAIVSTTKRTGTYSLKIPSATSVGESVQFPYTATANTIFVRVAVNVETLPSVGNVRHLFMVGGATAQACICRVNSSGQIGLWYWNGSSFIQVAWTTGTITTGQWYVIEMKVKMDATAGFRELKALGETLGGSVTWPSTENTMNLTLGSHNVQAGAITAYYDDVAVNDDQGSNQNGYPGDGRALLLHPASDNADGSWRLGGGTTGGDLSAPLRTLPPPGVASANETDSTNIESAANSATDNYDSNLQSYTTGGIVSGDTINLVQALVRHGEDIATSTKAGAVKIVSNPAQTGEDSFTFGNDQGAHGLDDPDNGVGLWVTTLGTIQYAPSVTLGTAPVLRVGKRTATTRVVCVDALGLYVDYTHPEFISASLSVTDDADTISAGATLPLAASVAVTDATDTTTTAVVLLIVATLTATDAADTLDSTAALSNPIAASLSVTDADDSLSTAVALLIAADTVAQDDVDTLASTGSLLVVATLTRTDDVDALDGAVAVAIVATSSNTDSGDALDATALLEKFAALDATDGDDTLGADATLLILATLSATDEDDALSASATLTTAINASLDATDADDSISSSAALVVVASVTVQDDSDTLGASSVLSITATLNVSDEADTPSFAAGIEIAASTSVQDAADTLDGIAYLEKFATLDVTDSDDSPSSDADVIIGASLAVTDAGDTLDAAGTVGNIINGDLTVTDADDSLSAGTTIPIVADSVMQDAEDQISSGATSSISAGFGIADDAETLAATSALLIQAALDAADESDTLLAYSSHGPIVADLNVTDESDVLEAQGGKAIAGSGDAYHYPRGSQYDRIMRLYARGKLKTKRGTIVRDPRIAREMARRAALREMEEINVYNQLKG